MKQKTTFLKSTILIVALFISVYSLKAQTLIAQYKFDNSITDETGNWNLTATDENSSITYEMGQDGTTNGAITGFDREDYLSTITNFSISGDASRTMTAWIKLIATTPQTSVVGGGINSPGEKWTFGHQGNGVRTEINSKGAKRGTLTIDTWHHIATVWDKDAATVTMYVDGAIVGDPISGWDEIFNTAEAPMLVGNDFNADPLNRGFNGAMDDVRVYTGAADAAFILAIYDTTVLSVSNNVIKTPLNTFPNPVIDRLYFSTDEVSSVEIYNILGAKVSSQKISNKSIDMSSLTKGIYLIKGHDKDGLKFDAIKVIKQ